VGDSERGVDPVIAGLVGSARSAAERAHAPYSGFRVGAAVLGAAGVHTAANVENASYGLSLCAERAALSRALAEGDGEGIRAIAVACVDAAPDSPLGEVMPCGACRQWLAELAPEADVHVASADGGVRTVSVDDLLPHAFVLRRS
jgi:cytidine deaminase